MSSDNPYIPPVPPLPPAAAPPRPAGLQPNGFMAICVLSIVLGALGTLTSVFGVIGLIAAPAIQSLAEMRQPGQTQAMHDLNVELQREVAKITDHWRPFSYVIVTIHLVLSIGLLTGGIWCVRRDPRGIPILSYSLMAAIGYEGLNLLVQIMIQTETIPLTARHMQRVMEAVPGNNAPPEMAKLMGSMMTGGMWFAIVMLVVWAIAKVVFDVIAIRYMAREDVQSYIGGKSAETPVP